MPPEDSKERKKELARRKRERIIIAVTMVLVVLVTYLETQVVRLTGRPAPGFLHPGFCSHQYKRPPASVAHLPDLPQPGEAHDGAPPGSAWLQTPHQVGAGVCAAFPGAHHPAFFSRPNQFVGTSIEFWFSAQVERSLYDALETSSAYNEKFSQDLMHFAETVAKEISASRKNLLKRSGKELDKFLEARRDLYDLAAARLFSADLKNLAFVTQ